MYSTRKNKIKTNWKFSSVLVAARMATKEHSMKYNFYSKDLVE